MTDPAPWRCPECRTWIAPHVDEHRCDPPSGGVAVRPVVAPYSPSTGVAAWPTGSGISVTPGITYGAGGGGGGGGGWQAPDGVSTVTVTAGNACDVYGSCGHASCTVFPRPGLALVTDPAA